MPGFHVPLEIANEIILHILDAPPTLREGTAENPKPDWKLIEAFTLTCWGYRLRALELWFRSLYLQSADDLHAIPNIFPTLKGSWTRHLHCVQYNVGKAADLIWDLAGFSSLTSIRIDWLHENTPEEKLSKIYPHEGAPCFINVQSPIKELDIRGLRYPTPMAIQSLTTSFRHIATLKIESLRSWCGLCNTCALIRFPGSTPKDQLYEGGLGLSIHYARILFSFQHLEEVIITLPDLGSGLPSPGFPIDSGDNLWTGECDRCMDQVYHVAGFKQQWMSRKRGIGTENDKYKRSVYTRPPSLKRVLWKFWLYEHKPGYTPRTYTQDEITFDDAWIGEHEDSDSFDSDTQN
ncbi:hypothetical protein HYPSUDRAFT_145210 [Hypholoma sublateritium FD-334 SS-4]|uniref:Uncharacterized protein n=1 Tax=Hypholoma sublateritium (strain FD-334 SS-4) TaxID=945553 RepID=A0A0D2M530_HYPSF|nr:hypothetical protein HYPSUDRAFT_145210 [Hypholoma sublateritium FD-334 SS-4]